MSKFLLFAFVLTCAFADAQVTRLTFRPVDAGYSLALDRIIFISANPNQLHIYNPATTADQTVGLAEVPLNLSVSPDGLHAAVAFSDAVAYVDLQAGTVARTFSNVAVGTGKVIVGAGYVYVMPSYEGTPFAISIATGVVTQAAFEYISGGIFDPSVNAVYTIAEGISPSSLQRYDTSAGVIGTVSSATVPYKFENYEICEPLLLSADSATIYSGCGAVYRSSRDSAQDMRYLGSMGHFSSRALSISDALHQIAAIPLAQDTNTVKTPLADTVINLYDSGSFNAIGTLATTPFLVNSTSFPAHGRWIFYNAASSGLFLITQADTSASLGQDYAIENLNLNQPQVCNATFGSTSSYAIAPGAYGTAQILSGEDCLFTAVSNVPWIVLGSGYYGSGNTTLTYLVRPNLTTSSRAGTITLGSHIYTVTQEAARPASALNPLSFKPAAADYDKALDKIVMVSADPNELHIYDPVSRADQIVALSYPPLGVSVSQDGLSAVVGHSGRISVVDLRADVVSKIVTVDVDASGVVLAPNGYAYAFPAQNSSWDYIDSIHISTGETTPLFTYFTGNIPRLDSSGKFIYVSSPLGASKVDISNGPASATSQLSGVSGNIWLSEDGSRLLESDGRSFLTSTIPSQDMRPNGSLSAADNVDWAANSQLQHQTAILTDPSSASAVSQLQVYSDVGLQLQSEIAMPAFSNSGMSYASHGKYIFWNASASALFSVTEADSTSGLLSDFAVYTVNAPESPPSCTYTVLPTSLNLPAMASNGAYNWILNVSSNCSWIPVASSSWLNLFSSGVNSGSSQIILNTIANTGLARSGTITVGNQSVQVNQAASTCMFSLSYSSQAFTQAGGTGQVGLVTGAMCPWSVQSDSSWLTVVSNQSGTGSANIQFSVASNNTSNTIPPGTLNIAGNPFTVTQTTVPVSTALNFVPVTPCRLFDTRAGLVSYFHGGESWREYFPSDACEIPTMALAYSINLTVIPHGPLSYITVWPDSDPQPLVSTLNSNDGRIKANAAIVGASSNGLVDFYVTNDTDVAVDIDGYFVDASSNTGLEFYPLTPCRLVDTRNASGPLGAPSMVAVQSRDFPFLQSNCSMPSSVGAYSLNFTAVPEHGLPLEYISVWPNGQSQPVVSTLNAPRGNIVANAGIVQAGTGGDVNVAATNNSDLVVDVNGYFAAPGSGGLHLYTVAPCRVLDTRATGNDQPFSGTLFVQMTGNCSIPTNAEAVVLNATAVPVGPLAYITLWPYGVNQPLVSTLNAGDGRITSNMAIVPLGSGGINAFATSNTHLILDVDGYFAP